MVTDGNLHDIPRPCTNLTCGSFDDERDAQKWLVEFLKKCHDQEGKQFFKFIAEGLVGTPLYRHHRQSIDKDSYKCDVLAMPQAPYSEFLGAIVFEVKKSGIKIGPPLSQLKDYMASSFNVCGIQVVPSFGFLFPCPKQHSATASWMQHQSMGAAFEECNRFKLFTGEEQLLAFSSTGRLDCMANPKSGRGSGSR